MHLQRTHNLNLHQKCGELLSIDKGISSAYSDVVRAFDLAHLTVSRSMLEQLKVHLHFTGSLVEGGRTARNFRPNLLCPELETDVLGVIASFENFDADGPFIPAPSEPGFYTVKPESDFSILPLWMPFMETLHKTHGGSAQASGSKLTSFLDGMAKSREKSEGDVPLQVTEIDYGDQKLKTYLKVCGPAFTVEKTLWLNENCTMKFSVDFVACVEVHHWPNTGYRMVIQDKKKATKRGGGASDKASLSIGYQTP